MTPTALEVLQRRRMCRDFSGDPLDEAALGHILDAGLGAPAAGNTHGLDLVVLSGSETARYWDVTLPEGRRGGFRWPGLLRAPVLVVPYVDPDAYLRRYSEPDKVAARLGDDADAWEVPYWFVDGGAAVMAMLVAAEALGLGALLFGQFHHEGALSQALGVPAGLRAVGTVAVGRAGGELEPSASARRGRPRSDAHVHRGGW